MWERWCWHCDGVTPHVAIVGRLACESCGYVSLYRDPAPLIADALRTLTAHRIAPHRTASEP